MLCVDAVTFGGLARLRPHCSHENSNSTRPETAIGALEKAGEAWCRLIKLVSARSDGRFLDPDERVSWALSAIS